MVNRSRPYGEHEWSENEAYNRFKKSHNKRDIDDDCPECGSDEYSFWNSKIARKADYDWCPECGYGRAYMATG